MVSNKEINEWKLKQVQWILSNLIKHFKNSVFDIDLIVSTSHLQPLPDLRITLAYFLRKKYKLSLTDIGLIMNRDHSSIGYMLQKLDYLLNKEKNELCLCFLEELNKLKLEFIVNLY